MDDIIKFQVSIAGYSGAATTLICALMQKDNVLVIADEASLEEKRREGFGMVSNLDLDAVDFRFGDTRIRDSITEYFVREAQKTLDAVGKVARHVPNNNAITKDGFDMNGPIYRLSPDITNGQIAVLAACAFANAQTSIGKSIDMMADMTALYSITTI